MNLFSDFSEHLENSDITITMKKFNGQVSVMVVIKPENAKTVIPAIVLTGYADELDKSFVQLVNDKMKETVSSYNNIKEYREAIAAKKGKDDKKETKSNNKESDLFAKEKEAKAKVNKPAPKQEDKKPEAIVVPKVEEQKKETDLFSSDDEMDPEMSNHSSEEIEEETEVKPVINLGDDW